MWLCDKCHDLLCCVCMRVRPVTCKNNKETFSDKSFLSFCFPEKLAQVKGIQKVRSPEVLEHVLDLSVPADNPKGTNQYIG